ncbi:hypothetical protein AB0G60_07845 [Streptomyces angustmyceticus]|uniref:Lipoprotein n=1 Tax=Streptomyces angustmyceticus TaxID=285578 RepID=A0A5J4LD07_9ACTN|nr:hypothetical protein [Streptomyces angustmyceticus]UAL69348.1 hypothetical protein K7396_24775 [Streptomyces angustmyceticus]GES29360.1 hypothetical protein San01_18470 [Streptomyces angustmyceticus]
MSSSTTVRTARRRTLRVAAAALVAAAGLTLTACSGADAAGTKPAAHTDKSAAAADSSAAGWSGLQSTHAKAGSAAETGTKAASSVRTQRLADGISTAEISKLGDQHYRAKIVARGSVLATMETNKGDAGLDANDMFVTLTLDGQVHSWMGGGHQGPGTFKLAGGWTAKVTKTGDARYRAQIIGHDGVAATLEANQQDTGVDANGIYIVLSAGGVISAHA